MDPMGNDKESLLPILEYHPLSIESIAINQSTGIRTPPIPRVAGTTREQRPGTTRERRPVNRHLITTKSQVFIHESTPAETGKTSSHLFKPSNKG